VAGPTFARHRNEQGEWIYEDEDVVLVAFEWLIVHGFSLEDLDDCLTEPGWNSAVEQRNLAAAIERRAQAIAAWRSGNEELSVAWLNYLHVLVQSRRQGLELRPLAQKGVKFIKGRKKGTIGPWRKAIAKMLAGDPAMKNAEMWAALQRKPPKGWTFIESNRLGDRFEGPGAGQEFKHSTFLTSASEERKRRKA
jgi:hypothetical protein